MANQGCDFDIVGLPWNLQCHRLAEIPSIWLPVDSIANTMGQATVGHRL